MDHLPKNEIDRLVFLADAGARQAAEAFAQLVGHPVSAAAPIACEGDFGGPQESGATGVFFEFEGCLDAIVGILFPEHSSERLVRRIVGIESGFLDPEIIESALMEVGNILASHVASAIADRLGERLLPSIPSLAMREAHSELETFIQRFVDNRAPRLESNLVGEDGEALGTLILVPTR